MGTHEQLNKIGTIFQNVQILILGNEKIAETQKAVEKQGSTVARTAADQATSLTCGFVTEAFTQAVPTPAQMFAKPIFNYFFSGVADATKGVRNQAIESAVKDSALINNTAKHAAFMKARSELLGKDPNSVMHNILAPLYPSPQENQNLRYNVGFIPTSSKIYNNLYKLVYEKALFNTEIQDFYLKMPDPESVFEEPKFKQQYPNFPNLAIVKEALEMEDLTTPYYSGAGFAANAPGDITTYVSSWF